MIRPGQSHVVAPHAVSTETSRSAAAPHRDRTWYRLLDGICCGALLLAAIQLPGAILDYFIRSDIGPPEVLMGVLVLLAGVALILRRLISGAWAIRVRWLDAGVVAFALAATVAQLAPALMSLAFVEVSDIGILIPTPGHRQMDCRGFPRRCHEHVLNELGFRGRLAQRASPDGQLVAMIGDSYVFGSGVGEDDTVPAVLARSLSDLRPPVAVVNAGIEGLAGGSLPGVIRYLDARLAPDLIVALLKDDDLDDTDMLSRWDRFRRSFWFRMLYVLNFEPIFEVSRQAWRHWVERIDRRSVLTDQLTAIAAAATAAQVQLIVVTALSDDLRPTAAVWMAAHPDVAHVPSGEDPRYWEAEKIPHDGHWTEAGCRAIAAIVAPAVRAQLSTGSHGTR